MESNWYVKAPAGSPDTYVTTRDVTFSWVNPPAWIYAIIEKADFFHENGSIYAARKAAVPTLICCVKQTFFFNVSFVGGTEKSLVGALPHDLFYLLSKMLAAFYGVSVRTILHIADHWFLATLRMSKWLLPRTYFLTVRTFGYAFNSLMGASK